MKYFIFFFFLSFSALLSQTKESIISSRSYYYGEAVAQQEQEARDRALKMLSEQIAVKVSSFNDRELIDRSGDVKDTYRSIINTYSNAALRNVQTLKNKTDDGIEVFCFIAKTEVGKIFEERKGLVRNIYDKAAEFENERNIADALKYYYFAVVLMNSIPEKSIMHREKNLVVEIPLRMNAAIGGVSFSVSADRMTGTKEREVQLKVNTADGPVRQLDFSFWDGNSQTQVQAVDGAGIFRLSGSSTAFDKLTIDVKYNYYESREEIAEVSELWDLVKKPSFKNSRTIALKAEPHQKIPQSSPAGRFQLENKDTCAVAEKINNELEKLVLLLDAMSPEKIRSAYASDAFLADKLSSLVKFNSPQIVQGQMKASINKTATGWEVRQLRAITRYPTLNKQAGEYLILDFDESGSLEDINFGILESLYDQFVEQGKYGKDWGNRQVIVKFVERYRTAFLTRNMQMLDSLFADEAVIIVGRELKKGSKTDEYQYAKLTPAQPDFSYTQYTKAQYLKNQRRVFQIQKDISIGFASFKITKKNDTTSTYGLSMKQYYASTTYADEGHLFLLVDFLQAQPQIYVRSWQPHEWNDDAIIKLANFKIYK